MRDITSQSIIPLFIMKQREQNHTWCYFPFLHICQLRIVKNSCKVVLLQVELHTRGVERKPVMSILSLQWTHYLTF